MQQIEKLKEINETTINKKLKLIKFYLPDLDWSQPNTRVHENILLEFAKVQNITKSNHKRTNFPTHFRRKVSKNYPSIENFTLISLIMLVTVLYLLYCFFLRNYFPRLKSKIRL